MNDLRFAMLLLMAASVLHAWAGWWIGRIRHRGVVTLVMAVLVVTCVVFVFWFQDQPILAQLVPWSGVVILGAWSVPLAAFGAGLAQSAGRSRTWLRLVLGMALFGMAVYTSFIRYTTEAPVSRDRWVMGVCLQTREGSCGAAAAATLLAVHGVRSNEAEMINQCLTRETGTTFLGLYRGLKRMTADTKWDVEPFTGTPDDLSKLDRPAILWLVLSDEAALEDSRYESDWGWQRNVPHAVVFFEVLDNDRVVIGDPAIGPEMWSMRALRVLWRDGRALRLVERETAEPVND